MEIPAEDAGTRTEVVGADKLITLLQQRAQAAVDAGSSVETLAVSCPFNGHGGSPYWQV